MSATIAERSLPLFVVGTIAECVDKFFALAAAIKRSLVKLWDARVTSECALTVAK